MKYKIIIIILLILEISLFLFLFYKTRIIEKENPIVGEEKAIRPWGLEIDEESLKDPKKIIDVEPIDINVEDEVILKIKWGDKDNEIGGKSEYLGSHGPGMWDGAEPPRKLFITKNEEVILEDKGVIKIFNKDGLKKKLNLDGFYSLEGIDKEGNFYLSKNGERKILKLSEDGEILFSFDPIKDIIEKYQLKEPFDINAYSFCVLPNGNFYVVFEVNEKMESKIPNPEDPTKTIPMWQVYNQFKVTLLFDPNGNLIDDFLGYFEVPIYNLIDNEGYYYVTKKVPKEKSLSIKDNKAIHQIQKFLINNFEYKYLDSINIVSGKWSKRSTFDIDYVEGDDINVGDINENGIFFLDLVRAGNEKDVFKYMLFDKNKLFSFSLPINVNIIDFINNKI
ncbi:MAG: hypothetical protein H5U37_00470, partial [Caldisericia bacterium]|nr:hypothetical protein [Caldisericia bacterium]